MAGFFSMKPASAFSPSRDVQAKRSRKTHQECLSVAPELAFVNVFLHQSGCGNLFPSSFHPFLPSLILFFPNPSVPDTVLGAEDKNKSQALPSQSRHVGVGLDATALWYLELVRRLRTCRSYIKGLTLSTVGFGSLHRTGGAD